MIQTIKTMTNNNNNDDDNNNDNNNNDNIDNDNDNKWDCIINEKQNKTAPCAYFMDYIQLMWYWWRSESPCVTTWAYCGRIPSTPFHVLPYNKTAGIEASWYHDRLHKSMDQW